MNKLCIFLKGVYFKRSLFFKDKLYLKFKFNVEGFWRRGSLLYPFKEQDFTVSFTTKLIGNYVHKKLIKSKKWTVYELQNVSAVLDQLVKVPEGASSKILFP